MGKYNKITDYDLYTDKDYLGNDRLYMKLELLCEGDDSDRKLNINKIDTGIYLGARADLTIDSNYDDFYASSSNTINIGNNKYRLEEDERGVVFGCEIIEHEPEKITMEDIEKKFGHKVVIIKEK